MNDPNIRVADESRGRSQRLQFPACCGSRITRIVAVFAEHFEGRITVPRIRDDVTLFRQCARNSRAELWLIVNDKNFSPVGHDLWSSPRSGKVNENSAPALFRIVHPESSMVCS